jgi:hypothetical protein
MVLLLMVQAAATWFMAGVIWVIQVVHYPLFDQVGTEGYGEFHRRHMRLITWIVGPAMGVEAVMAVAGLWFVPGGVRGWQAISGVVMVAMIWGSTALWQVPAHRQLAEGFDGATHRRLVRGNWVRTVLWTLRGVLVGWMVMEAVGRAVSV